MNTRTVAPVLFTLACCLGLPSQALAQLAMVAIYSDCVGACNGTMGRTSALFFPGGSTGNANDISPTWSPDGAHLAFERQGEILVINIASGSPFSHVNITSTWAHDSTPAWSPDGAKIAFVSDRDGQPELYVMKPD